MPRRIPTPTELAVVDTLQAAYMACNAARDHDDRDSQLAWDDGPAAPMTRIREAALAALRRCGLTPRQARDVWEIMLDGASPADYSLRTAHEQYWVHGEYFRR